MTEQPVKCNPLDIILSAYFAYGTNFYSFNSCQMKKPHAFSVDPSEIRIKIKIGTYMYSGLHELKPL